jgi:tetratricopeptide (TPR) repeat protein
MAAAVFTAAALGAAPTGGPKAQAASPAKARRAQPSVQQLEGVVRSASSPTVAGQARLELVRIYQRRGDWMRAAEHLEELRKLAPDDPEYAYQLGVVYRNISRWAFFRMQTAAPGSARVRQIEAEQYAVTGDTARAIRHYQEAIAADPKMPGSHLGLALLHARANRREDAIEEVRKELAIAPESAIAMHLLKSLGGTP